MRYKITADSTCDLGRDLIERYDIGILPLYVQLGEKTYRDGIDIQPDDIYAHVAAGGELATTAAVNLADYVRTFTELSDRYDFVIHVNISSDFSCSHQNAKLAAADLPNVYVVDSRSLSTGHGHIVLEAARMAAEGMEPEEIVQQLEALTARVDALMRRSGGAPEESSGEISQPPFLLNTRNRTLEKNGQRIKLTQVEYSIMRMFMENPGKALSREEILDMVWGRNYFGELKIVDVNIRRLRLKIEDNATNPVYITTVWGYGYKWGF